MENRIATAMGERRADTVFRDARVVDVFCHRIVRGDVAVTDGVVVGLGVYEGETVVECEGRYLMPGFVDSHVHVESSLLTPAEYARVVAPWGVTTVIADPHEIANVCGEAGIAFMIASAATVPVDFRFMLPSCVPATPMDNGGAVLDADEMARLLKKYDFLGLGEMMNYVGVVGRDPAVLAKLALHPLKDGHAPSVAGPALNAYAAAGMRTDHECSTVEELTERVARGMYVQLRQGTAAKNVEDLAPGITPYTARRLLFCTDDRNVTELVTDGSISNCIRHAQAAGADPIDTIMMASLNAAECYGLGNVGAIAPGYRADLLVCDDLSGRHIRSVYKDGVCIARDRVPLFLRQPAPDVSGVTGTMHLPPLSAADFVLPFRPGMRVIDTKPGSLYTREIRPETSDGLNLCAVIERHRATGNVGLAYVNGIHLRGGAIAQSIGHDAHNLSVLGDNAEDMLLAVRSLGEDGGMVVVVNGSVEADLPLPYAGLLSDKKARVVDAAEHELYAALQQLDCAQFTNPFMLLSFLSLPVIPELKLTDTGLFDVVNWRHVEV